ncbi:hypothetical protein Tco_1319277 [Tanacetum coccineum]
MFPLPMEQLDEFDLEEMDLKWQVAMISMRLKKFYKKTDQKEIKKAEEEMQGTLDIKQKTIGGDLENRRNLKLCNLGSDTEMSAKNKSGLGYGDQVQEGVLSYENEVFQSVFDSRSSDVEDSPVHDRFVNGEGMHAVPPPMIGNYMPPGLDRESNSSVETLESVPEPVVVEPIVVSQPKVWSDAPIIKEYEVSSDENIFSHLIKDYDFHEKRMAKQVELNKKKGKGTGQGENRPVWNNVQRLNHQNKFVPKSVLTKTDIFLVNTARQNLSSQATTTSTARKVNTARPIMNEIRPRNNFYKSHSPIRRPFNRTTAPKANFSNQKVNTAEVKAVSVVGGKRETVVKPSADNPQRALKNKWIVNSGCSRHMTGNKAYLVEYQDYNGGPVAFRGSKGYITSKDEAGHKELGDILVRAVTTASSLEAEQVSRNINKTQSKATPNESSSLGTTSGGGLRVLDLEKTKTTQHNEIASLKRRVKKLEKKNRSRTHKLKRLYKFDLTARVESSDNEESLGEDASKQGRIDAIDADKEITLVISTAGDATTVSVVTTTATITTVDDINLAQALMEIKNTKPKEKGVVIQELGESTTTISSQLSSQQSQDKGKGILIEPVNPMKKKDLIRLDEEAALKLQARIDEEEKLAREKAEKE